MRSSSAIRGGGSGGGSSGSGRIGPPGVIMGGGGSSSSRPLVSVPAPFVPDDLIAQAQVVLQGKSRNLIIRELQVRRLTIKRCRSYFHILDICLFICLTERYSLTNVH